MMIKKEENNMDKEESIEYAKKMIENILSFFGINVDVSVSDQDEEVVEFNIPSTDMNQILIGRKGETLRSLQTMVSAALRDNEAAVSRINIDIADYKKHHAEKLAEKATKLFDEVKSTGETKTFYLNAADRRVVHQAAADVEGIMTYSEGIGRDRHIIIAPAGSKEQSTTEPKAVDDSSDDED